jgi:type I restriction enzyme R subunit
MWLRRKPHCKPIYQYTLRQGIEDGFLAPCRVHRIISEWDVAGWWPSKDELDRYGRAIPDGEYGTKDFERVIAQRARTNAIAHQITEFLKKTDRFAKTIVFCVDQEHTDKMRRAIFNLNHDLVQPYPDYVCRVTSDEGGFGRGYLGRIQDVDTTSPVILTTSQLLTTGVAVPTCKNVVPARIVGSMSDLKQIIGRGTRVRDDYGKLWLSILDYTGSATRLFADPDFDGGQALVTEEELKEYWESQDLREEPPEPTTPETPTEPQSPRIVDLPNPGERRKFYFDDGQVEITAHLVYELKKVRRQASIMKLGVAHRGGDEW